MTTPAQITAHSPLPWRQSAVRPHALVDATGEPVLLACAVAGGPHREVANLDLLERAVNGHGPLEAAARLALALLDRDADAGSPGDVAQARGLLRRALEGGQALAAQPA